MKRTAAFVVVAVGTFGFAGPAWAHEGGHQGGCEEFGRSNLSVGKDPGAWLPGARNLGDIVSSLTALDDGQPGVGDFVESVDHAACRPRPGTGGL
jgi:hypothetical protein